MYPILNPVQSNGIRIFRDAQPGVRLAFCAAEALYPREFLLRQVEAGCRNDSFHLRPVTRAHDSSGDGRVVHGPGCGHYAWFNMVCLADLPQQRNQLQVA